LRRALIRAPPTNRSSGHVLRLQTCGLTLRTFRYLVPFVETDDMIFLKRLSQVEKQQNIIKRLSQVEKQQNIRDRYFFSCQRVDIGVCPGY